MSKLYKDSQSLVPEVGIPHIPKFKRGVLRVSDLKENKLIKNGIKYLSLSLFSAENTEEETTILANCHVNFDLIPEHPINFEETSLDEEFEPPMENSEIRNASSILDRQLASVSKPKSCVNANLVAIHKYIKYISKMNFKRNLNENPHLNMCHKMTRGNFKNMFKSISWMSSYNMVKDSDLKQLLPTIEIRSTQLKNLSLVHSRLTICNDFASLLTMKIVLSCADIATANLIESLTKSIPLMRKLQNLSIFIREVTTHYPNPDETLSLVEIFKSVENLEVLRSLEIMVQNISMNEQIISTMATLIKSLQRLEAIKLELSNCLHGANGTLNSLSSSIMTKSTLKEVELKLNYLTKFRYLDDIIGNFGFLKSLEKASFSLDLHKLTPYTWKSFLHFLAANNHIKYLSLTFSGSNFEIDFPLLTDCIGYLNELRYLRLTMEKNKLCEDEILRRLSRSFLNLENLKTVQLDTKNNDHLTDDGLRDFCLVLRDSNFLDNVFMNLEGCDISLSGLYEFYAIFPTLTITSMDI